MASTKTVMPKIIIVGGGAAGQELATQQQLLKLGIELKRGRRVVAMTREGIVAGEGELIPADLKVLAASIKAPDWLKELDGLETNRVNQLVVDATLKTSDDNIFAMGDCAACSWIGHVGNVPPRAQAAHQQASTLHKTIVNQMHIGSLLPTFTVITVH